MTAILNGKSTQSTEVTELAEVTELVKKPRSKNNKGIDIRLDIDAGSKRVKCRVNGVCKSFPSEAKEIKGEVPLKMDGCFKYKSKAFVVGNGIDRVNGSVINAHQDNKLVRLDLWIIGAITHYRKILKDASEARRRKGNQPVNINLYLRILTLSSMERKTLDKSLKLIESFEWEDTPFSINVKSIVFEDEGLGAIHEITNTHSVNEFHLLDLGGGTFTHSSISWDGNEYSTLARTPISGAGMVSILNRIFKALTRTDRGSIQSENQDIQEALELSTTGENGHWTIPLRSNGKSIDISDEVMGALSEWVSNNYALQKQFDLISQRLARGEKVFCTGGGFAIKVIAKWLVDYLSDGIENAQIFILDNPHQINLEGLKWLDKAE